MAPPRYPPLRRVEVDGRSLAYRSVGTGPPLLLLHGKWSDSRSWRLQLESLSDELTVVAWDAPGCGGSDDPPRDIGLSGYADAVAALLRALGLERPHVLGLSWGGGLAIELAHRHPDVVRSLVLVGAYAGWAGSLPAEEVAARVRRFTEEATRPPLGWVDSYLPGFFAGPVDDVLREEVRSMMLDARPAGTMAMLTAFAAADLRDVLPTLDVPTLVLHGELDVRAPMPVAGALHDGIPGSELVVLPGTGHVSNVEAPDAFDAAVRRFLHRPPPAPPGERAAPDDAPPS